MNDLINSALMAVYDRLVASERERNKTRNDVRLGRLLEADTPERIEKRKMRLLADTSTAPALTKADREILASGPVLNAPPDTQRAFESTIGTYDGLPCWFLLKGWEARRTVGRIYVRSRGIRVGWGTGFLVAPNLLLTNQHVISSLQVAQESWVEFDYEESFGGIIHPTALFNFRPDLVYISSPADGGLDYALIGVESTPRPESGRPTSVLTEFGYNFLFSEEGKLIKGESINALHHPEGQPRQVSMRNNRLLALEEPALNNTWMHYETDTLEGSSGSPLFNNQWEVVGVHHAAAEKRDENGNILALGGGLWEEAMGKKMKWWYANEGLRISYFMKDVERRFVAATAANVTSTPNCVISSLGRTFVEMMLRPVIGATAHPDLPPPMDDMLPLTSARESRPE
ncbi:trypsin-like serine peptidase [Hymenobacter swuensis]|uniref:Serine protease n=1 Tax=Hymenobacter swuensis DY53 TaxID=1227739 RepID=W8EWL9_9BACT|nr:serine protease [Hymenobacter swuensis]AHJ96182.1 hypothetical protein Hsw_0587 [Hymenobacter swuensis DY53]